MKIRYFFIVLIIVLSSVFIFYNKSDRNYAIKKAQTEELRKKITSNKIIRNKETTQEEQLMDINILKSKSACLYDCKSKRVLYGKDAYVKLPMASTTKILTCIIALENMDLNDQCIVSKYASSMPKVKLSAKKGEKFIMKDLLYSLMLESHNDTAVVIAETIGAKRINKEVDIENRELSKKYVNEFIKLMNKKVRELGLKNTNFVTPNGLDADKHYTTAVEMAKIASYAIKNKDFLKITNTRVYSFSSIDGKRYVVNNKNQFLNSYKGAIGCKTGYTSKAGYCFVGAINRGDYNLVSVVLGCGWPPNKNYKWLDTKKLMDYGINNYKLREIHITNEIFKKMKNSKNNIEVEYGLNIFNIKPTIDEKITLLLNENDKISVEVKLMKKIVAPIKKNDIIGYANVILNGNSYKKIYIRNNKDISRMTYMTKFTELLKKYMLYKVDIINYN